MAAAVAALESADVGADNLRAALPNGLGASNP